ncbi:SRPBCC domain-containing protein [Hyphomicrobium sp. 99]|uniref:SRPBCC family protein n=1 Tax=Hyphomicrobium sp. 99 TaxID=1163419 RepID=UPI0005F7B9FF|nr:SRPBCC domain-containing protein [Hyphomicrobium sp. 99]
MNAPAALVFKRVISGSPDEIFEAWTQPELMRQWLAPGQNKVVDARTDVRVGGTFYIRSTAPDGTLHTIDGTYRDLDFGRRIVMTWSYSGPVELLCKMETLLEIDLASAPGGQTSMTVVQTHITTPEAADGYREGWPTCFDKLETSFGARDQH